ncbi:MAG TPA: gamma-glutamyltransferase, partial [Chitinophagaceae bacterium]
MKRLFFLLLPSLLIACHTHQKLSVDPISADPNQYTIQKRVIYKNGSVVSAHPLASKAGVEILKRGGNAIDAAIATQLALAVVFPNAGNIGGGGFMVTRLANGKLIALDYREMAPQHASRDMYLDANGNVQPNKSINGHLASGVP